MIFRTLSLVFTLIFFASGSFAQTLPDYVLWAAFHELPSNDLSEWTKKSILYNGTSGGSFDNGKCLRKANLEVSTRFAHRGRYSMPLSIDTSVQPSGCRQFRHGETRTGPDLYHSAWLYFPERYTIEDWSNIIQIKSKVEGTGTNDAVWVLEARNRPNGTMHFMLRWKGIVTGPFSSDGRALKLFPQDKADIPVGKWFHIELFLKQSENFDGQVIVWQDDVEIFNMNRVKTKYVNGNNEWSINAYAGPTIPRIFTLYVDDAAVSRRRLGRSFFGGGGGDTVKPGTPKNLRLR